ncbi:hypothetical protein CK203_054867 [Vitis vinifera]|uniref:Uncharacterized protein n=1 Tax=Vitis vinifera TaxID=29760 RepID=A0A438GAW9_VITVI|nr:hypothetical protein CK203_054867 [Vitis vinifera]
MDWPCSMPMPGQHVEKTVEKAFKTVFIVSLLCSCKFLDNGNAGQIDLPSEIGVLILVLEGKKQDMKEKTVLLPLFPAGKKRSIKKEVPKERLKIPAPVAAKVERLQRDILWSGIREGKWLWRYPREGSALWHQVILSIYGSHSNGWDANTLVRWSHSCPWKAIAQVFEEFSMFTSPFQSEVLCLVSGTQEDGTGGTTSFLYHPQTQGGMRSPTKSKGDSSSLSQPIGFRFAKPGF